MKLAITLITAALLTASCGTHANNDNSHNNNENHNNEVTAAADACEHMIDGPAESVEAVATGGDAPTLADTHTRYDIVVVGGVGMVQIEVAEAGDLNLFFDADVDVTLVDANDTTVPAEEAFDDVAECEEVVEGVVYDVSIGTYLLTITTTDTPVGMVMVPGGDHGHE